MEQTFIMDQAAHINLKVKNLDENEVKGQAADTPAGYVCRLGYVSSPYRICVGVKELASAIVVLPPIRVGRIIGAFIIELMDENTVATGVIQTRHGGG
ncbi:hypothetical protein Tco_0929088, partial [Tanacetum coccineum]